MENVGGQIEYIVVGGESFGVSDKQEVADRYSVSKVDGALPFEAFSILATPSDTSHIQKNLDGEGCTEYEYVSSSGKVYRGRVRIDMDKTKGRRVHRGEPVLQKVVEGLAAMKRLDIIEERMYHVWVENTDTGFNVQLTGYPEPHKRACTFMSKQTKRKHSRYYLKEVL